MLSHRSKRRTYPPLQEMAIFQCNEKLLLASETNLHVDFAHKKTTKTDEKVFTVVVHNSETKTNERVFTIAVPSNEH